MKLVFFINSLAGGGAERVVSTLTRHFSTLGHEVRFITLHKPQQAYPLPANVIVEQLKTGILAFGPGKFIFLPLFAFELTLRLKKLKAYQCMSLLTRSNLVHILTRIFGNKKPILISERCTRLDYQENFFTKRPLGLLVTWLYPYAHHIVAISDGVKTGLIELEVPAHLISRIHNPQPIAELQEIAANFSRSEPKQKSFEIVMAGRLTEQKDYPTMLRALKILRQDKGLPVTLKILGEGPLLKSLQTLAHRLGISESVEWLGFRKDAYQLFCQSDLFVFSSLYEGFGNVLVEAMACGIPVVSTDCKSGPAEILDGGKYGSLVPVGDSLALAEAIVPHITDSDFRLNAAKRAVEGAQRFDVSIIASQYVKVFENSMDLSQ